MKKIRLAITRHTKSLMLALAIVGGSATIAGKITAMEAVGLAFNVGLIARCKKEGLELDANTEKVLKGIETEINEAAQAYAAKTITKEQFDEVVKEKAASISGSLDATKIMVGTGEAAKSLDSILREQGENIAKAMASGNGQDAKKSFADMIEEKMADIENIMKSRKGSVEISTKDAAIMTVDAAVDVTTNTIPRDLIESMSLAAFAGTRYGRQFISDIADRTTVQDMEQYTTWLEEGSEQGAFAVVSEGTLKPLTSHGLVRNYAEAQKIAGKYVVTEEFVKFRQVAYSIIRRLIMDKMLRDFQAKLVTDLNSVAAAYTGTTLDDTIEVPNDYDAIGAVCAQIESLNFTPNVIILNPQDAWRMRLTKDSNGSYLFPVTTENGVTKVLSLQMITSTYQTAGYFTVGESGLYKIEEEPISVRIGHGITDNAGEIESDVDHNRFRVIVETFFKSYLPTPYVGSFVRTQFSTVKTALLAPAE